MSVLTDANQYASSSRIRSVFRYLLQAAEQRESREMLEGILSPMSLLRSEEGGRPKRDMIRGTINESLKMRLLIRMEGTDAVAINPELPEHARNPETGDEILPLTLARLMLTTENKENHNIAMVIAWYLAQDPYDPPRNWREMGKKLNEQVGSDLLEMNDARYSQFEDWTCYLGFAWRHSISDKILTPDPTAYLRRSLDVLFEKEAEKRLPLGEFIAKLGKECPVFETGVFRTQIESQLGRLETEQHISASTALGFFRLQGEGLIELSMRSDAEVFVLPDGERLQRYSHITRLKQN